MTPNLQKLIRLIFNYLQIDVNLNFKTTFLQKLYSWYFISVGVRNYRSLVYQEQAIWKQRKKSFVTWETPAKLQQEFKKTSLRLAVSSGSWSHELMRFCYLENFSRGRLRGKCVCKTKAKKAKKRVQHITNWRILLLIVALYRLILSSLSLGLKSQ